MFLSRLLIRDFRNIENADLMFSSNFNFFIGENGSGKTNIFEAIYMLGHGRTFHNFKINQIIRNYQKFFILHGRLQINKRKISIGLSRDRDGNRKIRINGIDGHKVIELALLMPTQLITPEGFILLNGGPKYRRAFLDWGCFYKKSNFLTCWSNFKRILKQRNAALSQVTQYSQLRPWNLELIPIAEEISRQRAEYSAEIEKCIVDACKKLLPEFYFTFSFHKGWEKKTDYSEALEKSFDRDKLLAYTTHGPHKADLHIYANGVPVVEILSRGQLKLLMCALKLAQGELLVRENGRYCLYLIDDFASELDSIRRKALSSFLKTIKSQVFLNAISSEYIIDILEKNSKVFTINKGKLAINKF